MRIEWRHPAGMNTAFPGGTIQLNLPAYTVIGFVGSIARAWIGEIRGGMVVEVLPGAPEETVARLESNIAGIRGVSHLLEEGGADHVVEQVLAGLDREVKEVRPLRYRCRCSRERLLNHLVLLPSVDRDYLKADDGAIEAQSEDGRGTTMVVRLPVRQGA